MNVRTKTGLEILQAAGLMGLLGNVLLREVPWGLNATLFVTAFTTAMVMLAWRRRPELLTPRTLALQGAMVFFAVMFLFRASIALKIFDTLAIIGIMGVLVLPNLGVNVRVAGAFHYAAGFIWSGLCSLFAPFLLLGADIDWKELPGNRISRAVFSVLRGLAIALPLVLIFGALFMAADAAYEGMVNRVFNFEIDEVISHIVLTAVFAWLTAGYFRGSLVENFAAKAASSPVAPPIPNVTEEQPKSDAKETEGSLVDKLAAEPAEGSNALPDNATVVEHINRSDPPNAQESKDPTKPKKRDWQNWDNTSFPQVFTLGTVETVIILGLVDLLFLSFVIVQVPYLFGGMELVQNTPDLKLADYARRGFGELVVVASLVLPILLVSHWLLRRDNPVNHKLFKALAGIQIVLLFVIMASAVQRLVLLTGEFGYGMTDVRFYPMVFMTWLGIVFIWFSLTVLRGSRRHFAWGALWAAIVVLGATNVMNPDKFIADTNIRLMQQGREFDGDFNGNLSADAIPTVLQALPGMSFDDQCQVKWRLHRRLMDARNETDIRSWSLPRSRAHSLLEENHAVLDDHAGCPTWMEFPEHAVSADID